MKGIEVSSYDRAKIRELHRNGASARDLAQKYELHLATIYRLIREKADKKKKCGRPLKMTGYQRGLLHLKMHQNLYESANKLANSFEFPVSTTTICRELKKAGFVHKRVKPRKVMSDIHKEKRREYAASHVTWTAADWARVVFTDEKRWSLAGNDGYMSIWTESQENPLKMVETNRKGGLMVWGAISKNGGLRLVCVEGSITAESYIDLLENDFFNIVEENLPDDFIWMHDNAPPHVALRTKGYLERKGITTMEWLPMSPDLNPIENIWSILQKEVYKKKKVYKNTTELWDAITSAWHALPLETFRNLYDSIPGRLIKVLEEKGERISY